MAKKPDLQKDAKLRYETTLQLQKELGDNAPTGNDMRKAIAHRIKWGAPIPGRVPPPACRYIKPAGASWSTDEDARIAREKAQIARGFKPTPCWSVNVEARIAREKAKARKS
jgi:hypothetical protein